MYVRLCCSIEYKVIYDQFCDTLDHPLIANFGERDFCQAILIAFGLQEEHYELGLTKVREGQLIR